MEIHPPEHPVRSLRDFAFHIFTVTIGILIALGLEAVVEAHRGHVLADYARADFRAEFQHNKASLIADQPALHATRSELEGLIAFGEARLAHKPATLPDLPGTRRIVFATSTAWETAIATQAVLHLDFAETQAITAAVTRQNSFNALQGRAEDEWFDLAAFGDAHTLSNDQVSPALQRVTIAYAYERSIEEAEKSLIEAYDKALAALH